MPKVRSLFLSDIHLGTRACQADQLLDFLREYHADNTFLIGDIVDFWAMSRSIHWSATQNTVVQKFLRRARHGERIVFIPGYWSLAGYAKRKVKTALNFIFDFEESAVHHARERGLDGVICGHIHWAMIRDIEGCTYVNCGDWVDSCTAIVEHMDGRLELVAWGATHPSLVPAPSKPISLEA